MLSSDELHPVINGRVGMCFLDRPDPRRQVALSLRMEELGYEAVWVCETRTARDAISVLGAIAYATHTIKLGDRGSQLLDPAGFVDVPHLCHPRRTGA